MLHGENSGKRQEQLGPWQVEGTLLPQRQEGRKRVSDDPGKFWGGQLGLGMGGEGNII